jgi:hypothetical protein
MVLHLPSSQVQPRSPELRLTQARLLLARIARIRSPEIRQLVIDALMSYCQAMDTAQWREAFLQLWRPLELVAVHNRAELSMREVRSRIALLLGQRPQDIDLLETLADSRNKLVHAGSYSDEYGLEEVSLLKSVCERSIATLLRWTPVLQDLSDLNDLYTHLSSKTVQLARRQRLIAAVRRRRSTPGAQRTTT